MGRQSNKEYHWARQLPVLLFSKEDREKIIKKKRRWRKGTNLSNLCLLRGDPHLVIIVGALQSKGDSDEDIYL